MALFDPIVVPYDGSRHAQVAAATARGLAGLVGARVVLVHAIPGGLVGGERDGVMRRAREMLAEEARLFATPVEARVVEGSAPEAVAAEAAGAGLLIVGSRGRSVVEGLLLGSVARALIRSVECPVLVVHAQELPIRRIVVGVCDLPRVPTVVRTAFALAQATGARLTLLHAVDTDPELAARPEAFGISSDLFAHALDAKSAAVFAPLRPWAPGADEALAFGASVGCLREAARRERAEVVVVGRTERRPGHDADAWTSAAFNLAIRGPFATLVV